MESINSICARLRRMAPNEASDWVLENFPSDDPEYGVVFDIIPKVSWRKGDQEKLAKYYLKGMPFASGRAYRALSKVMPAERFLRIAGECMPEKSEDVCLVLYYLIPALSEIVKSDADRAHLDSFIAKYAGEKKTNSSSKSLDGAPVSERLLDELNEVGMSTRKNTCPGANLQRT
ncbi:hypothetical protein [Burkholderia sp. SIMBA_062]|uniref:hypothetical protein n=1 Tax=Burkholderia sp. SIMBA_062 TaxID=3085803 RepID=UPI00397912AE